MSRIFFDALSINVKLPDDNYSSPFLELVQDLAVFLKVAPVESEGKCHKSYNSALIYESPTYKIILNYHGCTKGMGAFIEVKGYDGCFWLAKFFNNQRGWHWSLTRADLTLDFSGGKATFSKLYKDLVSYGKTKGVDHFNVQGDWVDTKRGRTLYVGSKESAYQIRLYEKSEEQWFRVGNKDFPPDIVRVETQYRVPKRIRKHITHLDPVSILAHNRNLAQLYGYLSKSAIDPISIPKPADKSDELKLYHMLEQYHGIIDRLLVYHGYKDLMRMIQAHHQKVKGQKDAKS